MTGSDQNLKTYVLDARYRKGPFEIVAEGSLTKFGDVGSVFQGPANRITHGNVESADPILESEIEIKPSGFSNQRLGYYVDVKYWFWPSFLNRTFLGEGFENPQLILVGLCRRDAPCQSAPGPVRSRPGPGTPVRDLVQAA